ncbi:unnamed protein product [Caenorhabditis nigoni]|uniref:G-protein coupled receptors family 1 profile domain-containing protein n=1 Tax=Caenorhabditis nigoni TaxID=1611254 RepID=A0A2G5T4U6_9PELO|nr:hypothetical protein B9Z55_026692 [Caenorhabditis nigoni]
MDEPVDIYEQAALNMSIPEGCDVTRTVYASIKQLISHDIIDPSSVGFQSCEPLCGLCYHGSKEWDYIRFNIIVVGIILPIVGVFGIVGNAISAFVYSRPEMRCSTNFYLFSLACSDTGVALTGIFLFSLETFRPFSLTVARMSGQLSAIVYPMGMIAQTCSVYFTMCAGVDCFVQVCLPEKVRRAFSRKETVHFLAICVLIFSVLYNVPHFFEGFVIDCYHKDLGGMSKEVCPATLRYNELYQSIYYKYMYAIFLAVGPLITLIVLNTFIIGVSVFGSSASNTDDTMSLILVVLLFISCNTIALIINIFESYLSETLGSKINYIVDLSNFLVVFNSSFNIIIYIKYSRPFADTLFSYFCRRKPKTESPGPGPPIMITEKPSRSKKCKETLSRLLVASQPETPPPVMPVGSDVV